jgi:hypothetical protein
MQGNVLLAAMALSVSALLVMRVVVATITSGRSAGRLRARTAHVAPGDAGQWHVRRIVGTESASTQASTGPDPANASGRVEQHGQRVGFEPPAPSS